MGEAFPAEGAAYAKPCDGCEHGHPHMQARGKAGMAGVSER